MSLASSSTKLRSEDIPRINYDQLVYKENALVSIFKCAICNKVPSPSVVRLSCEHIFCKDHIIQELKRQYLQTQEKYSVNINEVKKKQDSDNEHNISSNLNINENKNYFGNEKDKETDNEKINNNDNITNSRRHSTMYSVQDQLTISIQSLNLIGQVQDYVNITCPKCNKITQLKTQADDFNQGNNEQPIKIILPFDENISKIVDTLEVYCLGNNKSKVQQNRNNIQSNLNLNSYNNDSDDSFEYSCHWFGPRNKLRKHLLECDNIYICSYCKFAMKSNQRCNHEKKCENIFRKRQSIVSLTSIGNFNDLSTNNSATSITESNEFKSMSNINEKKKGQDMKYISCINSDKGCPLTHISLNEYKNHIWKCEYQEKDLNWVIQKHKFIEINHKKQIKALEQKNKEQLQKIEKLEENIYLLKDKYYALTILSLDPNDKAVQLELHENNTYVKHIGLIDNECWASVRSNMPISNRHQVYYYEVKIIFRRSEWPNFGAIGYCTRHMELSNRPGYSKNSSGYCNYTGDHYEHGNWTHYGPSYEVGDVVGCCINFIDKKVFYTKNGKNLGMTGIAIPDQPIFVCIGLYTGSEMKVNFGQEPFVFDIEGYKKSLKVSQRQQKLNAESSNEVVEVA